MQIGEKPIPRYFAGTADPGVAIEGVFYFRTDTNTLSIGKSDGTLMPLGGGGGGGVSSFGSPPRTGAVVPAAGDYTGQQLGDFLPTQNGNTVTIGDGFWPFQGFQITGGTITIEAGFGDGFLVAYLNARDSTIHVCNESGSPDLTKITITGPITVDPDLSILGSSTQNGQLCSIEVDAGAVQALQDLRAFFSGGYLTEVDSLSGALSIAPGGPGYVLVDVAPDGPTGLWQKWNVSVDLTRGPIDTAIVESVGSGYSPNDVLTFPGQGSNDDGQVTIDTVDDLGGILTCHVSNPGTFYYPNDWAPTGGTGSGALFNFTVASPVPAFVITNQDNSQTTTALASALTQLVAIFALPAQYWVEQMVAQPSVAFTGVTTPVATYGMNGDVGTFLIGTPQDLTAVSAQVPANGKLDNYGNRNGLANGGDSFSVAITATVQTLDQLTAGSLDIWVKYSVLPS